jgi:hypothetical protein
MPTDPEVRIRVVIMDEAELTDLVHDVVAAVFAQQADSKSRRTSSGWGTFLRERLRHILRSADILE